MTTKEAEEIIMALKEMVNKKFDFPEFGDFREYEVRKIGDYKLKYVMNINRKTRISEDKCTFVIRDKMTGTLLLRLDVNGPDHVNPDKSVVPCPHLHIYKEKYDYNNNLPYAIPFNIENPNLISYCVEFLKKFNIINYPVIIEQSRLFH